MEMQNSRQLAVTRQQAWDALNDPEVLRACIPGCDSIEATGDNAYAVSAHIKVGPVAARFKSTIELTDIVAPESYTLNFQGSGGAAGFGKGSAQVSLTANEHGCLMEYQVTATVGGKLAQVGQRLIDGVAKSMADKFFEQFDEQLMQRHPGIARPEAGDTQTGPGSGPEAAGTTAAKVPAWLWVLLALLIALGVVWVS